MIRVTVEMYPGGGKKGKRLLGMAIIANDGTGTETRGNYNAGFGMRTGRTGKMKYYATVENFPRKSLDVWHLLRRCLNKALR